jgi:hypothetical protein
MQSEYTTSLDILAMRDFNNKKGKLLNWVLLYDLAESAESDYGIKRSQFVRDLVSKGIISTASQGNQYLSHIEWALDYDDDFGFTGDYENANLVGSFTSITEIRELRYPKNNKAKANNKKSPKNDFENIAKRITNGMNKKQREALAIAILAL